MADLITRVEYKQYAGITSANNDTEINILIPKVSQIIKNYCRRGFTDYWDPIDAKIEFSNGGVDKIILKETPVIEVYAFEFSTDYGVNWTPLTDRVDWVLDEDTIIPLKNSVFNYQLKGYKITYTAGFEFTPEDIKLAAFDLVKYYLKNNSAVHVNRDVTPNVTQIQYVQSNAWPAHIKRVLDQYVADYT